MRRSDREITDISVIDTFISNERILRVGFFDNGEVYIVPVNYGYINNGTDRFFYFHGAKAGRKYELAKNCAEVGFEIDGCFRMIENEEACGYSAEYRSVIGNGELSLIDDIDEKKAALDCLMEHQTKRKDWSYSEESLEATALFCIRVSKMTCKSK